ncbi:DUF4147 domain-containing protein [Pirellulales bacterium]|nr:DUF4147 domain-containing protein [Pirellulales bacterium]
MPRSARQLRDEALAIWTAGLNAVRPERLIPEYLATDGDQLCIGDEVIPLASIGRIAVVGGGKAGAGMVAAVETALGPKILADKRVAGVVNVPADCVRETRAIELVAARPPGVNEPTPTGVAATERILDLAGGLGPEDVCLCLISGGGSALMESPAPGVALDDLVALTRELSANGATIGQLNAVRRSLSSFKGGGLRRACRAGRLVSLILSDVLGDDLATIASGPTIDVVPDPDGAIAVLQDLGIAATPAGQRAIEVLTRDRVSPLARTAATCETANLVIGNNAAAVDAAGVAAERLGYSHAMDAATASEGTAEEVAEHLAKMMHRMRTNPGPDCLITGGEPTVRLAPSSIRGRGGRNQQLVLAAMHAIDDWQDACLLSGGTDGEDGPTDAAGAVVNQEIAAQARSLDLNLAEHLERNDAYRFFEQAGGLIKTGPTNTNVCDVRVVTVSQQTGV